MMLSMRRFLFGLLVVAAVPAVRAAVFVAPQDDALVVRRDELLLDESAMRSLAGDLAQLAAAAAAEPSPHGMRAAAQFLALGNMLDANQKELREVAGELAGQRTPKAPDEAGLARARKRVDDMVGWLESPEAGATGQKLASYLKDPLAAMTDAGHAKVDAAAQERWKGIVAPLAAFQDKPAPPKPPKQSEPETSSDQDSAQNDPQPPHDQPATSHPEIKLETAAIEVPFLAWDAERGRYSAVLAKVKGTMKKNPEKQGFSFRFPTDGLSDFTSLVKAMRRGQPKEVAYSAVRSLHPKLPEPVETQLSVGDQQKYVDDNIDVLVGAAAVLMDASLSGIEPRKDVVLIGYPDAEGKWRSPRRMWERLKTFSDLSADSPGGLLVVPTEAAATLEAFLVFEKPEFFLKYEVVLAGTYSEVVELVRSTNQPAWFTQASANFAQLRKAAPSSGLGVYLASRPVRERLQEIRTQAPRHASAALLLKQGSGLRPFKVCRQVAAEELRIRTFPMASASGYSEWEHPDSEDLKAMFDKVNPAFEDISGKISSDDRALLDTTTTLITSLKALMRYTGQESQKRNLLSTREQFAADWKKFRDQLATAAGEPTQAQLDAREKQAEEAQKAGH